MKRSYSLDLIRLFLAYVIALFHFDHTVPPGPTVTVQVFFVISGYFLARKYYSRSHCDGGAAYSPWRYTLDHIRSFLPHYLVALVLYLCYELLRTVLVFLKAPSTGGLWELLTLVYDQLPDLAFLQTTYQYGMNLNRPTWQLSALVIAGYFVYALLCYNEKLSRRILFPGAILIAQCLLADQPDLFARVGPIFLPLLRAFAPLCVGVLTYYFSTTQQYEALKQHKVLFNVLTLLPLPAMMAFQDRNGLHLIWSALLILGCMEPSSVTERLLGHKCFAPCAKLSYVIYLEHALIGRAYLNILRPIIRKLGIELGTAADCVVYLVLLTAVCLTLQWTVELVLRKTREGAAG